MDDWIVDESETDDDLNDPITRRRYIAEAMDRVFNNGDLVRYYTPKYSQKRDVCTESRETYFHQKLKTRKTRNKCKLNQPSYNSVGYKRSFAYQSATFWSLVPLPERGKIFSHFHRNT